MIRNLLMGYILWTLSIGEGHTQSSVKLLPFDLDGSDSMLVCAILHKYIDYTRYFNNIMDPAVEPRIKVSSKAALSRMTSNRQGGTFSIFDESLEGKRHQEYPRDQFIDKVEALAVSNVVFEKRFLGYSCPTSASGQVTSNQISNSVPYTTPAIVYVLNFIENTSVSREVTSVLRNKPYLVYDLITKRKELKVRVSKELDPDLFYQYQDRLDSIQMVERGIKKLVTGKYTAEDSLKIKEVERKMREFDHLYAYTVIELLSISETDDPVSSKDINRMNVDHKECNCGIGVEPADEDADGYSVLVDCDDHNATVYPGAPVNIENGHPDDNCDGEIDRFCSDLDGDGYVGGPECGCDDKVDKKCDCNDSDDRVYPGASIDCQNNYSDDNCDGISDSIQLQQRNDIVLSSSDYLYPPWGLTKFGSDSKFYVYSGLMAAGITSALIFKVRSDQHYRIHKRSASLAERDSRYNKANGDHKRFLVSLAGTAGVYIFSQVDLSLKYGRHKRDFQSIEKFRRDCVEDIQKDIRLIPLRPSQYANWESSFCISF